MFGEIPHGAVLARVDRVHGCDAFLPSDVDQMSHQEGGQSLPLPFVADGNRAFAAESVGARAVTADANLMIFGAVRDQGHERHLAGMIEVRELPQ